MLFRRTQAATQPQTPYPYIRAWGRLTGAYAGITAQRIERAQQGAAPETAMFEHVDKDNQPTGRWYTVLDIPEDDPLRAQLHRWAQEAARCTLPAVTTRRNRWRH